MILVFLENPLSDFRPTEAQVERFRRALPANADLPIRLCRSEAEFVHCLPEATAALVWRFRQEWFDLAPRLRHVATPAAGRDYFRVTPPPTVTMHYGTFHGAIMAETALGAVLAMAHGLLPFATAMKDGAGAWPRPALDATAHRLALDTVTVLGCGHIGGTFATLVAPLAKKVHGIHRTWNDGRARPGEARDAIVHRPIESLDEILKETDHLVCFLPSGPETDRLLDDRRLGLLKPTACVYNFGRGNLIDEDALARRLSDGRLGGAVLDVFREEPLPADSPLRTAPRCYLYPHASAFSPDYLDLWFSRVAAAMAECRD